MQETLNQQSYSKLINLGENLISSVNELNIDDLESKIKQYTNGIKEQFETLKLLKPTKQNLDELRNLMLIHQNIEKTFNEEREKLSKELKKLRAGKVMKNTYLSK